MEVNADEYTVVQLRAWLKNLNIKSSGKKAEMVARLNTMPIEIRGTAPPEINDADLDSEYETDSGEINDGVATNCSELELLKRERDILKRERNLLQQENELLKQKEMFEKIQQTSSVRSEHFQEEEVVSLSLIKELMPEFNENSNFEMWATQVRSVRDAYHLSENAMRAIIISKLKGKALNWVHCNVNCTAYSVDRLLQSLEEIFGTKQNKLTLRHRFEERKWNVGEAFADYFNEKNALQLEEDELLDYMIEGTPDEQLRMHAYITEYKCDFKSSKEHSHTLGTR